MTIIVYGTTGELIKILPLIKSMPKEELLLICTYQQPEQLRRLSVETKIPNPDYKIGRSPEASDLEKLWQIPFWFLRVNWGFLKNARSIIKRIKKDNAIVLVHGDTITTVVGGCWGRLMGFKVGHIEAGLRSHNWRHPFPEEIDRLLISRIARIHFSPGKTPQENLVKARVKGEIVQTNYNTVLDSLRLARDDKTPVSFGKLQKNYAVVSIHRNELMAEKETLKVFLETIREQASKDFFVFLDHPVTKKRISELGYDHILDHENIMRLPKLSYFQFIKLVGKCDYALTDSGGLQEETAYLGIPCLVHRVATEREEGLGSNVVLSKYDNYVVKAFLKNPKKYKRTGLDSKISPTQIIVDYLQENKFIN